MIEKLFGRKTGGGKAPAARKEPLLQQRAVDSMRKQLDSVEDFLTLEGNSSLDSVVRDCFEAWRKLPPLLAENDRAEIVLSAYYREGKIRDFLRKLRDFVDRMDAIDSDETAREMGYCNYLFFLEQFVETMKSQYEEAAAKPCPKPPELTPDNVAWFIGAECGQIAPIQDLPKVWTAARRMLDQAEVGQKVPEKFRETSAALSGALETLKGGRQSLDASEESIRELHDLASTLEERAAAISMNIRRGTALYEALTSRMTAAWFRAFDPETGPVGTMSRAELKAFYREQLDSLRLPEE